MAHRNRWFTVLKNGWIFPWLKLHWPVKICWKDMMGHDGPWWARMKKTRWFFLKLPSSDLLENWDLTFRANPVSGCSAKTPSFNSQLFPRHFYGRSKNPTVVPLCESSLARNGEAEAAFSAEEIWVWKHGEVVPKNAYHHWMQIAYDPYGYGCLKDRQTTRGQHCAETLFLLGRLWI